MAKTVQRSGDVVTLSEAREQARIDDSCDNLLLQRYINSAVEFAEGYTRRAVGNQTITVTFPDFGHVDFFSPVLSVTSVKYYDSNNAQQTLDASIYEVDTSRTPEKFRVAYGKTLPMTYQRTDAVEVIFEAGDQPESIRQAILMLVAHWYNYREDSVSGQAPQSVPFAVDCLLYPWKVYDL